MSATTRDVQRWVAGLLAVYGLLVAVANARNDLVASDFTSDWVLVGGATDFPGDFGRNILPGSIALGLVVVAVALAVHLTAGRAAAAPVAALVALFAVVLVVGYRADGNLLGAKPSAAAVLLAASFALASTVPRRPDR